MFHYYFYIYLCLNLVKNQLLMIVLRYHDLVYLHYDFHFDHVKVKVKF